MTQAQFNESVNREVRRLIRQGEEKAAAMTITNQKCICLHDEPQGIRPGPNARIRVEADPKCRFCGGEGLLTIEVSYDPPPIPVRDCDWSAIVDGWEETGPQGYGRTKVEAVSDLMIRLEEVAN